MICTYELCDRDALAKGLCAGHYSQSRKGWQLRPLRRRKSISPCSVPGCVHDTSKGSHGYCGAHWLQKKAGHELKPLRGFGVKLQWIFDNAKHQGDDCLVWPFPHSANGRGGVKVNGAHVTAPKAMCIVAHGAPPTSLHQAAHSCGNGHLGCLNPRHLRWATVKENAEDRIEHGTQIMGEKHHQAILTEADVLAIRRQASSHKRQVLADMYGVSYETIIDIVNYRSWRHI